MTHFDITYQYGRRGFPVRAISRNRQRGAALFVSLMMLILLSLLAVSAAQVTGLQERMAGIYRSDIVAFEGAEAMLRERERALINEADPCHHSGLDPTIAWRANPASVTAKTDVRNLASGEASRAFRRRGSSEAGQAFSPGSVNCLFFNISAIDHDNVTTPTSTAVVQSVYVP